MMPAHMKYDRPHNTPQINENFFGQFLLHLEQANFKKIVMPQPAYSALSVTAW